MPIAERWHLIIEIKIIEITLLHKNGFGYGHLYLKNYISCKNGGVFMTHEQFEKADRNLSVWRKTKMYVLPFTISMMDLAV